MIDAADQATDAAARRSRNFDTALGGWTGSPRSDRNIYEFVATRVA